MTLEKKSLVELRGICQSLGMIPRMDRDRAQLLQDISQHVVAKITPEEKPIQVNIITPNDQGGVLTQGAILDALKGFRDFGLDVSFPDDRTWRLYCNKKEDTGTMFMPLWNIIQVARQIVQK